MIPNAGGPKEMLFCAKYAFHEVCVCAESRKCQLDSIREHLLRNFLPPVSADQYWCIQTYTFTYSVEIIGKKYSKIHCTYLINVLVKWNWTHFKDFSRCPDKKNAFNLWIFRRSSPPILPSLLFPPPPPPQSPLLHARVDPDFHRNEFFRKECNDPVKP